MKQIWISVERQRGDNFRSLPTIGYRNPHHRVEVAQPDGYRIAPHWHPLRENVTVISGTFKVGMRDTFDKEKMATFLIFLIGRREQMVSREEIVKKLTRGTQEQFPSMQLNRPLMAFQFRQWHACAIHEIYGSNLLYR
ncbi:MAG TPA: cupin domain-containing protein [Terriglobales bacterium]